MICLKKKTNTNSETVKRSVSTTTMAPSVSFNNWNRIFFDRCNTTNHFLFRFKQVDMTMKEANKFMVTLSVDISDVRNRLAALKQQAMSTCVNKKWAGLVELMALASVIKNSVFSVYPNASPSIRPLFHRIILPREVQDGSCDEHCFIMWSRCSSFDTERVFQPNHFVTMSEEFIQDKVKSSYSDIVSGRNIKYGKLERATGKSFSSNKKKLADLKSSKVETNRAETNEEILSPTQSTRKKEATGERTWIREAAPECQIVSHLRRHPRVPL